MTVTEKRQESLSRAVQGQSLANYPAIIAGFLEKGIPVEQISPRENVFTFNAWKALGRSVKKGEHGVKVFTFVETKSKVDEKTGELTLGSKTSVEVRPCFTSLRRRFTVPTLNRPLEVSRSSIQIPALAVE